MTSLITSTRVDEGHHDRVTVWNRGANAGTLTVQKGDGAEVAARLMGRGDEARGAELAKELDATNACFDLERSHRKQVEREKDGALARVAELEAERDALRTALIASANALPGTMLSDGVSTGFLCEGVPEEVRLVVVKLTEERDAEWITASHWFNEAMRRTEALRELQHDYNVDLALALATGLQVADELRAERDAALVALETIARDVGGTWSAFAVRAIVEACRKVTP